MGRCASVGRSPNGSEVCRSTSTSSRRTRVRRSCVPVGLPLECVVTGLSSGTAYTFTVTARNAIGTSDVSEASTPVTPSTSGGSISPLAGSPAAPTVPTVVRHLDDTVVVSWTAPADNNVPITGYQVTADPSLDPVTQPCVALSPTSCMIRNLPILDPDDPVDLLDLVLRLPVPGDGDERAGNLLTVAAVETAPDRHPITPALGASPTDPVGRATRAGDPVRARPDHRSISRARIR